METAPGETPESGPGGTVAHSWTDGGGGMFATIAGGGCVRPGGLGAASPGSVVCHVPAGGLRGPGSASANRSSPASSSENAVAAAERTPSSMPVPPSAGAGTVTRPRFSVALRAMSSWPPRSNAICACSMLTELLVRQPEVSPRALVVRVQPRRVLQRAPRGLGLPRLEVAERQVDLDGSVVREAVLEGLVDLDGARVEPQAKVDGAEQVLTLGVGGLHRQRELELLLGLEDAVLLQQLAAPVEMEEEVLLGDVPRRLGGHRVLGRRRDEPSLRRALVAGGRHALALRAWRAGHSRP